MPGRQIHRCSERPRKLVLRGEDRGDDGWEEPQRLRVAEAIEDDPGVDSANAIQEGPDPDAEGPPADEGCVVRGMIVTWPFRAHRRDDTSDAVWRGRSLFDSEWRRKGSHR